MQMESEIEDIARRIKAAQDQARHLEPISADEGGFDLPRAYAVAQRIHEARLAEGAVSVGRKIGFTNSNIWPRYGVDAPIWGYIYDTTVVRAAGGRAACGLGGFVEPRIEPEIVVHFAAAPPAGAGPAALLGCIDWVAHAFEIVQSHYPGWRFRAADTVADSALHGALLVGEPLAVDELGTEPVAALKSFTVTLSRDSEALETGKGANVLGGPLAAVAHLIAALAGPPPYPPLRAGEMVTTGTLTAAYPVRAGERWSTKLEGIALPGLSAELTA